MFRLIQSVGFLFVAVMSGAVIQGGKVIEGALLRTNIAANGTTGVPSDSAGIYRNAGVPTVNVTLLGTASVGSLLTDTVNGVFYVCTATNSTSTIVWTKVGVQV